MHNLKLITTIYLLTIPFIYRSSMPFHRDLSSHNPILLPGSIQQMDFCVNGKGSASSLRRSIDTKIHLL